MRSSKRVWVGIAIGLLVAPQLAAADDDAVAEQLQRMNDRLSELEDRLQATNDELDSAHERVAEQEKVLRDNGLDEEESKSSISSFLEATSFSGWVATSYTYNFANSGNDGIVGQNRQLPFHSDSNAFAMNQLWFEIDKPVNEEGRAGFHADILFGRDAEVLGGNGGFNGNDGIEVFTAYVSYLAPIGENGIRLDAGELPTLIGAEVVQAPYNFNITRGNLWGVQPVTNTGVLASTTMENGLGLAIGALNDVYTDNDFDTDNNKTVTGQLSYGQEYYSAAVSMNYGSPASNDAGVLTNDESDKTGILDFLVTADPSDDLSMWINFDWVFADDHTGGPNKNWNIIGVAAAGRYQVLENTGFALRGEFVDFDDTGGFGKSGKRDGELWSITGTLDQEITENLIGRLEGRFDFAHARGGKDNFFKNSNGGITRENQHVVLAELIYNF